MPNYCENYLSIEGNNDTKKLIMEFVKSEENAFDFDKIVPMPDYIYRGVVGERERKIYGENNWYDWSVKNWGTKWNSADVEIWDDEIQFQTAWSPCDPVIAALAEKFPTMRFTYTFYEPGMAAWVRLATEIPYLSPEIMEQEIKDCKEVEEAHTVIIGTACRCFNAEVPYHEAMQALLKEKIEAVGKEREAVYARKREEYWAAHAEEKQALEARKAETESRRAELLIPSNCFSSQIDELNSQIEPLQDQLNSLGMFKVKQIKVLSDQVDELRMQLAAVKEAAAKEQAAIQDKVRELDDIISEIDAKLLTPFL